MADALAHRGSSGVCARLEKLHLGGNMAGAEAGERVGVRSVGVGVDIKDSI